MKEDPTGLIEEVERSPSPLQKTIPCLLGNQKVNVRTINVSKESSTISTSERRNSRTVDVFDRGQR